MDASEHEAVNPEPTPPPPTDADWVLEDPPDTKWPKVIGIISLIYALGGLLCQLGAGTASFMTEFLMGMGGMDVTMPMVLKVIGAVTALLGFLVGLVLLFGAINLLRRKRSSIAQHKRWAVLRLILIVVALLVNVVFMNANIEFQRASQDAVNRMMIENGQAQAVQEFDENGAWTKTVIMQGVFAGVFSAYPLFIGFYLSRKKIADEVDQWI